MPAAFEELDVQATPMGELILRRRQVLSLGGRDVWEVLLDGRFLMSSLVHDSERALTDLGLATLAEGSDASPALHVLVGGLGLGYTAATALEAPGVTSVTVVDALPAVIDWHRRGLVPLGETLAHDPRCTLMAGDFFAQAAEGTLGGDSRPAAGWDAILVDIDHSPRALLHPSHEAFYAVDGLTRLRGQMAPGGVFALWSADLPEQWVTDNLGQVFEGVRAEVVEFENPLIDRDDANTIYLARRPR